MKLAEAFHAQKGDIVAFVGAGGKTSALAALGAELSAAGWRVLATTTTRIGRDQLKQMRASFPIQSLPAPLFALLESERFVFLYDHIRAGKVYGFGLDQIDRVLPSIDFDACLIEADGARMLPLKAPKPREPAIPACATLVIPILSLSILGKPLEDNHVYNARALAERYQYALGAPVRADWIARMLQDEAMLLKNIPPGARVIPLLNHAPRNGEIAEQANSIAEQVMKAQASLDSPRIESIAIGTVPAPDPIHKLYA